MIEAKPIKERIEEATNAYHKRLMEITKEEEILTFLKSISYLNKSEILANIYFHNWRISISIYKADIFDNFLIDIEEVIKEVAGPLHRHLNIDGMFKIETENNISLISTPYDREVFKDIKIMINLDEKSKNICHIEKTLIREKTDEELERERYVYEYKMECGNKSYKKELQ